MTDDPARLRYDRNKRRVDVVAALALLLLTAPLQLAVAVAVRLELGSPVLFRQIRPGLHGKAFRLVKFRTMRPVVDPAAASDAARLTRLGTFLRATSLDELPTFWIVLRGDMSFVGPRPLLLEYLDIYTPEQARRHDVRPGITGLAQVKGRNTVAWEDRFRLDVDYVQRRCLRLDVQILVGTIDAVLRRRGIHAVGQATVSRYTGATLSKASL